MQKRRAGRSCLVVVILTALGLTGPIAAEAKPSRGGPRTTTSTTPQTLRVGRAHDPARSVVSDSTGRLVATFTDGSRTVDVAGPRRTFTEPGTAAAVTHDRWVRLLAAPFDGQVDHDWLAAARSDTSPDLLAIAFQYVAGAAQVRDGAGLLVAGDASYGPLQDDGRRQEGADWNDYQQVTHTYATTIDAPEAEQAGALDCSGFLRMVLGRRLGVRMSLAPNGIDLPRRAVAQAASAPGIVTIPDRGVQVTELGRLQPGDLVFFDASDDDGADIDHAGLYLGVDRDGRHRFFSSRKSADGPTMGDLRGRSTLDGSGLYATAFRTARRV